MKLMDLNALAGAVPEAWRSRVIAEVGPARIKVLRMDGQPYPEETHSYNEGFLVVEGLMELTVRGQPVEVRAGELYVVDAGTPHAVAPGSHGTLVIVDLPES